MTALAADYPLTIYYDAACPLCAKEMHALRDYDRERRLRLVDCSAANFSDADAQREGVSRADMLRLIRARDAAGRWFVGVDVFVLAYRAAGIETVASLWEWRWLRPIWDRLYPWIARYRMPLSRFGITGPFNRLVRWAAARSLRRTQSCKEGHCRLD